MIDQNGSDPMSENEKKVDDEDIIELTDEIKDTPDEGADLDLDLDFGDEELLETASAQVEDKELDFDLGPDGDNEAAGLEEKDEELEFELEPDGDEEDILELTDEAVDTVDEEEEILELTDEVVDSQDEGEELDLDLDFGDEELLETANAQVEEKELEFDLGSDGDNVAADASPTDLQDEDEELEFDLTSDENKETVLDLAPADDEEEILELTDEAVDSLDEEEDILELTDEDDDTMDEEEDILELTDEADDTMDEEEDTLELTEETADDQGEGEELDLDLDFGDEELLDETDSEVEDRDLEFDFGPSGGDVDIPELIEETNDVPAEDESLEFAMPAAGEDLEETIEPDADMEDMIDSDKMETEPGPGEEEELLDLLADEPEPVEEMTEEAVETEESPKAPSSWEVDFQETEDAFADEQPSQRDTELADAMGIRLDPSRDLSMDSEEENIEVDRAGGAKGASKEVPLFDIPREQLESAIERVIESKLAEKIDALLNHSIEKAVSTEISKLKRLLTDTLSEE